ncbi:aminoacyl-tRNA hydrolase [Spiroplasma culicicola]|uniref:Peptidyl-tRNA hydrolase n=1 Tax=Spiroplasma culicicola AES-1 TaxID=1276246 RepID=W6A8A4_9MOLU|nr:aminoacyl-tRNA hydrolase [Spiroplasma culicicola]AHI53393.1 peptidyl-tRNA hydrolase [Spiroplasma culicicola AES-1]
MPKLIIGLGNPGKQYEVTRHNAGFIAIDCLLERYGFQNSKEDLKAQLFFSSINGEKVIFAKPQTFMNLSGQALIAIMNFYKINIKDIIVIYDDKDLPLASARFREKGSAGGHNGIKNIIALLGSDQFNRLRIGIDPPPNKEYKIVDWVLSKMNNNEIESIKQRVNDISDFLKIFVQDSDFKKVMNMFNK